MFLIKFCSQCGEKIKRNRLAAFALTSFCSGCKKQARFTRFVLVMIFMSLTIGSFLAGRLTTPRQQFHFIGDPIDLQSAANSPAGEATEDSANTQEADVSKQTISSADEAIAMCGAPTKAGRPCRRKVRGGGTCYQHKDKLKASARPAQ